MTNTEKHARFTEEQRANVLRPTAEQQRDALLAQNKRLREALEMVVEQLGTTDTGNNAAVDTAYHVARAALKGDA